MRWWRVAAALVALGTAAAPARGASTPQDPTGDATPAPVRAPAPTSADADAGSDARSDSLQVFLVTFGPGSAVYERFGHDALWIHDPAARSDVAYHYGLFDMSESGFLTEFLQGRMFYSMGANEAAALIDAYRRWGRDATVQELALTAAQARDLQRFLTWNMRPENRVYRYDYFRDNCATRIRDAMDRVLGGQLASALQPRDSPATYRSEALSLVAGSEPLATGMDLGLGPLADTPLSWWQLSYIPMRLRDAIRDVEVARDGGSFPLVVSERYLPPTDAAPGTAEDASGGEASSPERAPVAESHAGPGAGRILALLLVGLLGGAILAGAGWLAGRPDGAGRGVARVALAVAGAAWGLLTGVLGLILLGLWTLTDHEFAWANENLLQANPLGLALLVLVPLAVAGRRGRAAWTVAAILAALSILGLLVHPLPLTRQANLGIIALALPVHLGLLAGLRPFPPG